jgi:predicted ATPase
MSYKPRKGLRGRIFDRVRLHGGSTQYQISETSISNFKSIQSINSLPLKRINLIYGQNSVGKSSFLQSFLTTKNNELDLSYVSNGRLIPDISYSGKTFDVGSFEHMSHMQKKSNIIKFGLGFKNELDEQIKVDFDYSFDALVGIKITFQNTTCKILTRHLSKHKNRTSTGPDGIYTISGDLYFKKSNSKNTKQLSEHLNTNKNLSFIALYECIGSNLKIDFEPEYEKTNLEINYDSLILGIESNPSRFVSWERLHLYAKNKDGKFTNDYSEIRTITERDSERFFAEDRNLSLVSGAIREALQLYQDQDIVHIPPIRGIPGRSGINLSDLNIDPSISYVYSIFDDNSSHRRRNEVIKDINHWLSVLDMDYEVTTHELSNLGRDSIGIVLNSKSLSKPLAFTDVGKGISQILPIITAKCAERNALILVEQPEIHLHPKLQADIADIFISSDDRSPNHFIVETHSENLLLRIQRRVREGILSPDDIQCIYLQKNKNTIEPIIISLDENGSLSQDFPDGFFEIGLEEIIS